jgi:hypothetical protein
MNLKLLNLFASGNVVYFFATKVLQDAKKALVLNPEKPFIMEIPVYTNFRFKLNKSTIYQ